VVSRPGDSERSRKSRDAASSDDEPHSAKLSDPRARHHASVYLPHEPRRR
jgi:hypothetical protein